MISVPARCTHAVGRPRRSRVLAESHARAPRALAEVRALGLRLRGRMTSIAAISGSPCSLRCISGRTAIDATRLLFPRRFAALRSQVALCRRAAGPAASQASITPATSSGRWRRRPATAHASAGRVFIVLPTVRREGWSGGCGLVTSTPQRGDHHGHSRRYRFAARATRGDRRFRLLRRSPAPLARSPSHDVTLQRRVVSQHLSTSGVKITTDTSDPRSTHLDRWIRSAPGR